MLIATVDTGTSNSRVMIWRNGTVLAETRRPVGVRDTAMTGNTDKLRSALRSALDEARSAAGVPSDSKPLCLASGMITSNLGLYELPHLPAPAGVRELAAGMQKTLIGEITDSPIWFIPGIRTGEGPVSLENCDSIDVMRGEETEAMGVLEILPISGPTVLALPGSHSKYVRIDNQGRIIASITTLCGEFLDVLTRNTLISASLDGRFADKIVPAALQRGAAFGKSLGLGRSAFLVRLLDLFSDVDRDGRANLLLGAVLSADLAALRNSASMRISGAESFVTAGTPMLRDAIVQLLEQDTFFTGRVRCLPDGTPPLSGLGAMAIARERGLLSA